MKKFVVLGLLALAGCGANSANTVATACAVDAVGQPVALALLAAAEPALAPQVNAVDTPVHAAVVAACAATQVKPAP